jgi:hypothetical protein
MKTKSKVKPVVVVDLAAQLAANLAAVKEARKAERTTLNDPAMIAALSKRFPAGTRVRYTGGRVASRKNAVGTVVGYRDGNGLYVEFADGKGSITPGKAVIVTDEPKAGKKAAAGVKGGKRQKVA